MQESHREREEQATRAGERRRFGPVAWVLLALPYVGLCFPGIYARATPALFGFPFFYWYQLGWVVLTSALLWAVYRMGKTPE